MVVAGMLESFGFQAAGFESAGSLLKSSQLQETSCLIVDVQMPGMNGFQLQRHLAASGYKIPAGWTRHRQPPRLDVCALFNPIVVRMVSSKSSSLNGLLRNATAPACIAC